MYKRCDNVTKSSKVLEFLSNRCLVVIVDSDVRLRLKFSYFFVLKHFGMLHSWTWFLFIAKLVAICFEFSPLFDMITWHINQFYYMVSMYRLRSDCTADWCLHCLCQAWKGSGLSKEGPLKIVATLCKRIGYWVCQFLYIATHPCGHYRQVQIPQSYETGFFTMWHKFNIYKQWLLCIECLHKC